MSLSTGVQITDGITGTMQGIISTMNIVVATFHDIQDAGNIDMQSLDAMQGYLADATLELQGLTADMATYNAAVEQANSTTKKTQEPIKDNAEEQERFTDEVRRGAYEADNLYEKVSKGVLAYAGMRAVKGVMSEVQQSLDAFDIQNNAEQQLANVLANAGATAEELNRIKESAGSVNGVDRGLYGDELFLGAAAELASYMDDVEAIESMMGTVADYAAGMSGGGELSYNQMVDYATQIGKAFNGTYDGLLKKGFELTEAQKKVIEKGTDMEKALVLDEVIGESWAGLYEQMSNTPQGKIIAIKNDFGDIREEIGSRLYPAVVAIYEAFYAYLPAIEMAVHGVTTALMWVVWALTGIISAAGDVISFFVDNWSIIGPVVMGVVGAFTAYGAVMLVLTGYELACTAATWLHTKAQWGLNAAMAANPVGFVIAAVALLIGLFYTAVAAVNHFSGTTYSATGMIAAAFMVLYASIMNNFIVPFQNVLAILGNFIGNVFNNPVAAVKVLFYDMAEAVIGYILNMASAIEAIINTIPGVTVDITSGLDGFYAGIKEARQKVKDESGWVEYIEKMDFVDYVESAQKGYDFGSNLAGFDISSIFGSFDTAEDYMNGLGDTEAYLSDIAGNTGSIKKSMDITEEELKYLRDIAETEAINKFTTASVTLHVNNTNNIRETADADGIVRYIQESLAEALTEIPEGV